MKRWGGQRTSTYITCIGTSDRVTVRGWNFSSANRVEELRTADNRVLVDAKLELLVQAKAAFVPVAAGELTLLPAYQGTLNTRIVANWQ